MSDIIELGAVTLHYDLDGNVTDGGFTPTIQTEVKPKTIEVNINRIEYGGSSTGLLLNAELVLKYWCMETLYTIDQLNYDLRKKITQSELHPNGMVKNCVVQFRLYKK